jgi:hypothetical protein
MSEDKDKRKKKSKFGLIAALQKSKGNPSQSNFGRNVSAPFKKKK